MQVALGLTGFAIGTTEGPEELIPITTHEHGKWVFKVKKLEELTPSDTYAAIHNWMQDEDNKLLILKSNGVSRLQFQEPGQVSDGYHTFDELYEHRIVNYITLLRKQAKINSLPGESNEGDLKPWRTQTHSDGSVWDGWFLLGIGITTGKQITYHLPMSKWDECDFAMDVVSAPEWDGHTSADVLERLKLL
jgi:hypothetical protein